MTPQSTFDNAIQIRPASLADEAIVYDFLCALEETTLDQTTFNTIYRQNLANSSIHYLVAEQYGEVLGFVSCHVQYLLHHGGKVGEIQELYVRPDVRNQRIGQKLVAALNALAIRENFVNLEVTTNQKRLDTIRFYERESFKKTHIKLVKTIQH
ncbi:GNAT family N-acetyltransferase [Spirosoma sp. HMF3257]|uniref:GNAT family N-acetyltransferase n=1 Tax=Spirosoma telluris TaxID=2183553 RepID=A0A327NLI6_9BACT|nr:GNAT family N-acetyltransferase [Spirosoma telluris]RAI74936.1 GNAT family N-acetyltransferase [Spirosoma telluris]